MLSQFVKKRPESILSKDLLAPVVKLSQINRQTLPTIDSPILLYNSLELLSITIKCEPYCKRICDFVFYVGNGFPVLQVNFTNIPPLHLSPWIDLNLGLSECMPRQASVVHSASQLD